MQNRVLVVVGSLVGFGLGSLVIYSEASHQQNLEAGAAMLNKLDPSLAQRLLDSHELVERKLGFRVTFPGEPEREQLPTGGWMYSLATENGKPFIAGGQEIPRTQSVNDTLAGAVRGILGRNPTSRIVQLTPCLEVPGARGIDIRIHSVEDGVPLRLRSRLLVRPGRMFSTVASDDEPGQRFIDSFELLPPAQAAAGRGGVAGS